MTRARVTRARFDYGGNPMHMKALETVFCDDGELVVKPVIGYDDDGDMTSSSAYLCRERRSAAATAFFAAGALEICLNCPRLLLN